MYKNIIEYLSFVDNLNSKIMNMTFIITEKFFTILNFA